MVDKILIVDDEQNILKILSKLLNEEGYVVKTASDGIKALQVASRFTPQIVLMDQNMPGMNGIETMEKLLEKDPQTTVIIITAFGGVENAVNAIKKGAYDYIEKPFDNERLMMLIQRAAKHHEMKNYIYELENKLDSKGNFDNIVAASSKMKQVIEQVKCVCETDATVLISGESGVGKEIITNAIHSNSKRKHNPLIAINCGAIPLTLMESEIFGHEKGAFTDAKEAKKGKFELANGGTLFLDEVGELSMDAQVKLLRVLEERRITRIGGKKSIPVDVRIISATNKNLEEKVSKGEFRLDLLYRLNVFTITIPSLRERKDDIPYLVEVFIRKFNEQLSLDIKNISAKAMEHIMKFDWPGNIRDLQNAIQSAMILAKKGIITADHLPMRLSGYEDEDNNATIHDGLDNYVKKQNSKIEKELILEALQKCQYNKTETAKLLKISRKTLFNKIKQYGI